ncbi:PREDICTED: uncharacterized protein LOC108758047 [Trachymyrmex cornetzi]|uniref:uncharacterized protein LOC108758047 n=1 Tax=Trachymyrmex cornetzi TaxID=471704 RepID=UPI00084EF050|nr:PREDICTED: uncharacterized protein LOC108758047 [Trachymyrmex cornetzi]
MYKLLYFNVTGLGESIRFLLNQCGIKFEDVRFTSDDWPKHKPNVPMGQVPVLEIDGKQYHQSRAIGRFLAKKGNLYGSDDFEAMEIDATIDSMDDIRLALSQYYWEKDPAFKEKLKETAFQKLPYYLDKFEAQVKKNGGYFVGGKLSWADLLWAAYFDYLSFVLGDDPNKDHSELKKLVEKVRALPNIKAYIEKRPTTQIFNQFLCNLITTNIIAEQNMPTYKLMYLNATGIGEPIRFLLSHCGIKFEDIRITFDEWPKYKPNMPMGQVPVLEIDGKQYHQSKAIGRFIAKKGNLYGSDDFEAMEIDAVVDSIDDIRHAMGHYYMEQNPTFKAKLKEIVFQKLYHSRDKFEEQVKKNGGYLVGGKLSWADFQWAGHCDILSSILAVDPNEDHPELKKLVEKVRALPNVKAYIEKRPKTEF